MNRRKALAVAGTVVATGATATLAMAANLGMLGFHRSDATSIGTLTAKQPIELAAEEVASVPTSTPPQVVVRYEDVYVPAPAGASTAATSTSTERRDDDAVEHEDEHTAEPQAGAEAEDADD